MVKTEGVKVIIMNINLIVCIIIMDGAPSKSEMSSQSNDFKLHDSKEYNEKHNRKSLSW